MYIHLMSTQGTRVLPCAALAAMVSVVVACDVNAANVKTAQGYSLNAPANWQVKQSANLALIARPVSEASARVDVLSAPLPPGMTLQRGRKELEAIYKARFRNFRWLQQGTTVVGGTKSLLNVASYTQGKPARTMLMYQVATPRGKKYYLFTGTTPLAQRAKYQPVFQNTFRSIRWTR